MSLPATDNFNRADANPIGGNWTTCPGWGAMRLLSNACKGTSASTNGAYWNPDTPSNDQYAQAKISAVTGAVNVRQSTSVATMYHCYIATAGTIDLYKGIAGAYTKLGASFPITFVAGALLRVEVSGTTITVYYNGVSLGTRTDSAIASGMASIYAYNLTSTLDDFEVGNLGASSSIKTIDDLARANVKTAMDVPIASVKTVDGVS